MSDTPAIDPDAPIDAEFEPAAPKPRRPLASGSPSWPAFLGLAALTVISLLLALVSSGLIPGLGSKSGLAELKQTQINLVAAQESMTARQSELSSEVETLSAVAQQVRSSDRSLNDRLSAIDLQITEIENRFEMLEADLEQVRDIQNGLTSTVSDGGDPVVAEVNPLILARLEAVETALARLETIETESAGETQATTVEASEEMAGLRADIEALRAYVLDVEQSSASPATDTQAAALAISAIEAAARRGRPFLSAYQDLLNAMPNDNAVQSLAPLAVSGAPTMAELRVQFSPIRRAALNADAEAAGDGSSILRSLFGDGVRVRRDGEINTGDVLDDAEAALAENDLARAIRLIEGLSEPVQTVFTDWLDSARQRESLESALEALRLTMIAKDRP